MLTAILPVACWAAIMFLVLFISRCEKCGYLFKHPEMWDDGRCGRCERREKVAREAKG